MADLYKSYPYPKSHPEHLYAIAVLFNMEAPDFRSARILELGCASGGNVIPIALQFPQCQITAIDICAKSIQLAQKQSDDLHLNNINFIHSPIETFLSTPEQKAFDYIICHGVFSWVSPAVQEKILTICHSCLTKNGLAYISYNTLPGWYCISGIRDIMRYHTDYFTDADTKAEQSRAALEFIRDGMHQKEPYFQVVEKEIQRLENLEDTYIHDEFLSSHNKAFYLKDFVTLAKKHKLAYVADSNLSAMFIGNKPAHVAEKLIQMSGDIIRTEQYLDFMNNRRFRMSILCHHGRKVDRRLTKERLHGFYVSSPLASKISAIKENQQTAFVAEDKVLFSSDDSEVIEMMEILTTQKGQPIAINTLVEKVACKSKLSEEAIHNNVTETLLQLIVSGSILIHADAHAFTSTVSDTPTVSRYNRYQATQDLWVTNALNEKVALGEFESLLLRLLDGTRSIETITTTLQKQILEEKVRFEGIDELPKQAEALQEKLRQIITANMEAFAENGLLVANT